MQQGSHRLAIKERTEVYWRNNRLYPVTTYRHSGRGPWVKQHAYTGAELVAIIEGNDGDFNITEGPCATPNRVNDSILLHRGISPQDFTTEIWERAPRTLLRILSLEILEAERVVSAQWGQFSNEEAMTGALFSRMAGEREIGRWKLNLRFIEFSKQVKEPITGTDIAVILDAQASDGRRSFKTLWLQAKRQRGLSGEFNSLPRFQEQSIAAENFTDNFYGLIYTPQGVYVTGTDIGGHPRLHTVIDEAMQCRLGDTSIRTFKNSLNRKRIFEVALTETV